MIFAMEQNFDFSNEPSYEERAKKRRGRIALIIALLITLVIAAIVFTLYQSSASTVAAAAVLVTPTATQALSPSVTPEPTPAGLTVSFLDVGQGDCAFLQSPSGKTMLIDGGPDGSFQTIDRFLTDYGVAGLDVVIASHLHADHIGGLIQIVDSYPIGNFYYPPFDAESETYFELLDALKASEAVVSSPLAGVDTLIPWDDSVEVRILSPYEAVYSDFNDTSYILRISYGNTAVLFTGDATELAEKLALKAQPDHYFQADVLTVAHHGSSDSTYEPFLDVVRPAIAIISVGANNNYGLPDQALLDRLSERGITIYRTDKDGTVTLLLDGTSVKVIN